MNTQNLEEFERLLDQLNQAITNVSTSIINHSNNNLSGLDSISGAIRYFSNALIICTILLIIVQLIKIFYRKGGGVNEK